MNWSTMTKVPGGTLGEWDNSFALVLGNEVSGNRNWMGVIRLVAIFNRALTLEQIAGQLTLAVDRVMNEGSLYDRELAALAVKQARGDLVEAIFLLRAYRTTLPRFGVGEPVDTARMAVRRRI